MLLASVQISVSEIPLPPAASPSFDSASASSSVSISDEGRKLSSSNLALYSLTATQNRTFHQNNHSKGTRRGE